MLHDFLGYMYQTFAPRTTQKRLSLSREKLQNSYGDVSVKCKNGECGKGLQ